MPSILCRLNRNKSQLGFGGSHICVNVVTATHEVNLESQFVGEKYFAESAN